MSPTTKSTAFSSDPPTIPHHPVPLYPYPAQPPRLPAAGASHALTAAPCCPHWAGSAESSRRDPSPPNDWKTGSRTQVGPMSDQIRTNPEPGWTQIGPDLDQSGPDLDQSGPESDQMWIGPDPSRTGAAPQPVPPVWSQSTLYTHTTTTMATTTTATTSRLRSSGESTKVALWLSLAKQHLPSSSSSSATSTTTCWPTLATALGHTNASECPSVRPSVGSSYIFHS